MILKGVYIMGRKPEERNMELYIPTWEDEKAAKELRSDIFEMVMRIRRPEKLGKLKAFVKAFSSDDYKEEPLSLYEFVEYLDFPMLVRLKDLFKDEEPYLITKKQIDELCTRALEGYMNLEGGVVNE